MKEAGLDVPIMPGWFALVGSAGLPDEAVARLNAATRVALQDPAVARRLGEMDLEIMLGTPAALRGNVETDSALWGDLIRRRGLRVE